MVAGISNETVLTFFQQITIWDVVKWFFVAGLVMYTIFAMMVVKQTSVMAESVESDVNWVVKMVGWVHLVGSILLVGLSIMAL